ncbi:MAG: hypothetical protein CMF96_12565 [Candidatus Marinimicrobia bacterium]|nr:hypothetical protein [Candidatus Neomarinimicrobiota bacterium]
MKIYLLILLYSSIFAASDYVFSGTNISANAGAITSARSSSDLFYQNPALLNEMKHNLIKASFSNLYGQKFLENQSLIVHLDNSKIGNIGFYFNKNSVKYVYDLISEQQFGISKGYNLQVDANSTLGLGLSINYYSLKYGKSAGVNGDGTLGSISNQNISQFGIDLGFLSTLRNNYRFGAFIKNINSPQIGNGVSAQYLPRRISISATYSPVEVFSLTFELENEMGKEMQIQSGIQYNIIPQLKLLTGIQVNPNRFGFGLVYNSHNINVGWSVLTHPILFNTHSFSIGYNF